MNRDLLWMCHSENVLQAAGLYVPCEFSLSMDTDEVDFKYYPHTFWKYHGLATCWMDGGCVHVNIDIVYVAASG